MKRRQLLTTAAACSAWVLQPTFAQTATDITTLLRKGGCALVLRYAQTEPGFGDPPGYRLDQCSTQRNLSDAGREQARQIGQWFKARGLQPRSTQTSVWCRCKDTAELAFGRYTVWGALGSTFDNRSQQLGPTQELRTRLKNIPAGHFEVWVTHQVNITALTDEAPAMGEAVLVSDQAQMLGRTLFTN